MSKEVDFIKIIQALEEIGCEVVEIKDGPRGDPSPSRALSAVAHRDEYEEKLSIVVWPCLKKD